MYEVTFTLQDVKNESSVDPWETKEEFSEEVNEEDMADNAAQYRSAADEAASASDLGEIASDVGAHSGESGGQQLIDDVDRDGHTTINLANGGEKMERVVTNIIRAIAVTQDTLKEVENRLDGGDGQSSVEESVNEMSDNSQAIHDSYQASLDSVQPFISAPPQFYYNEHVFTAEGVPGAWRVPFSVKHMIRQSHIDVAIQILEDANSDIEDSIENYRHQLGIIAVDLSDDGYNVTNSLLGYWSTEEMAAYNGRQLNSILSEEDPDVDLVEQYLAGLGSFVDSIFLAGFGLRPDIELESADLAYAERFFNEIDRDSLAAIGALGHPYADLRGVVANGINALMNEDIGGSSIIPPGVQFYLEDAADELLHTPITNEDALHSEVERYNNFGALMESARVPIGEEASHLLFESAMSFQEMTELKNEGLISKTMDNYGSTSDLENPLVNTGSSGLLYAAALDTDAPAKILADESEVARALGAQWADSDGIASFINSATIQPSDDTTSTDHTTAAFNVLAYSATHHNDILGGSFSGPGGGTIGVADHQSLQGAITETAVEYMDRLARTGDSPPDGPRVNNGEIEFDQEHRDGIFQLMAMTDPSVNAYFKESVHSYQSDVAYRALAEGDAGDREVLFNHIGRVEHMVDRGESMAIEAASQSRDVEDNLIRAGLTAGLAISGVLAPPGSATTVGLLGAGFGFGNSVFPHTSVVDVELADRDYDRSVHGDWSMRHAIADGAIRHAQNENGYDGIPLPDLDYTTQDTEDDLAYIEGDLDYVTLRDSARGSYPSSPYNTDES